MIAWSVPGVSGLDRRLRSEGRSAVPVAPARARCPRRDPRCRVQLGTVEESRRDRGERALARSRLHVSIAGYGHPIPSSHGRLTRARRFDRFPRVQAQSSPPSCPPLQLHGRPGRPAWRRRFAAARTDRSAARRIHPRARARAPARARGSPRPRPPAPPRAHDPCLPCAWSCAGKCGRQPPHAVARIAAAPPRPQQARRCLDGGCVRVLRVRSHASSVARPCWPHRAWALHRACSAAPRVQRRRKASSKTSRGSVAQCSCMSVAVCTCTSVWSQLVYIYIVRRGDVRVNAVARARRTAHGAAQWTCATYNHSITPLSISL